MNTDKIRSTRRVPELPAPYKKTVVAKTVCAYHNWATVHATDGTGLDNKICGFEETI